MKIALISDVHLEYNAKNVMKKVIDKIPSADILVCAGDIGNPFEHSYRNFLSKNKQLYKTIIVIPGNHEYYNTSEALALNQPKSMKESEIQIKKVCDELGVVFLQKGILDVGNVRFYGCTLWGNPGESGGERYWSERYDYKHISDLNTVKDYTSLHIDHKNWLESELSKPTSQRKIAITHHIPSYKLVESRYKGSPRNGYYASNCDDLVEQVQIWFAGHTHRYIFEDLGSTKIFCNPVGYPWEDKAYKSTIVEI